RRWFASKSHVENGRSFVGRRALFSGTPTQTANLQNIRTAGHAPEHRLAAFGADVRDSWRSAGRACNVSQREVLVIRSSSFGFRAAVVVACSGTLLAGCSGEISDSGDTPPGASIASSDTAAAGSQTSGG